MMSSTGKTTSKESAKPIVRLNDTINETLPEGLAKLDVKLPADAEMNACYEELKTEVLVLRRQLPQLKDANGTVVTNEIIGLREQLRKEKLEREKLEARVAELDRRPRISEWNDGESSIVSQFTMDRESARRVAESLRTLGPAESDQIKTVFEDQNQALYAELADFKARYAELTDEYAEDKKHLIALNEALHAEVIELRSKLTANAALLAETKEKLTHFNQTYNINLTENTKTTTTTTSVSETANQELLDRIEKLNAQIEGLNDDILKRDKLIRGFQKICAESLKDSKIDATYAEKNPRKVLIRKLYATFDCLDEYWSNRVGLAEELKNFVDAICETDTYSIMNDKLANERSALEKQINDSSYVDTSVSFNPKLEFNAECSIDLCVGEPSMMNGTADITDLQYMKRCYTELKNASQKMFSRLQNTADFLVKLVDALQKQSDPTSRALLDKIYRLKLDVTIGDVSCTINNAELAEKSMNAAIERSMRMSMNASTMSALPVVSPVEVANLKAKIEELESKLADTEAQLYAAKAEITVKVSMIETIEKKLANYKEDVTSLDQLLSKQRRAAEQAEFEKDEIQTELTLLKEKQDDENELMAALETAKQQVDEASKAKKELEAEVAETQAAYAKAKKEVSVVSKKFDQKCVEFEKLNEELTVNRKQFDEVAADRDMKAQIADAAERKLRHTVDERAREHERDLLKLRGALEKMTSSCDSYDAYLKAIVQKALCSDNDESIISPPEFLDASTHDALITVVSAPKKLDTEAAQRVVDQICQAAAGDNSIIDDVSSSSDLRASEVLQRVTKSKDQMNQLVQVLKKLSSDPTAFGVSAPRLLAWGREIRETLTFALTHLQSSKENSSPFKKHVPAIIHEMKEIHNVLHEVHELRIAEKIRNRAKTAKK